MFEQTLKNQAKINLTPLIDIIFQLVIFFMLSTTFIKTEALDVFVADEKPQAPQGAANTLAEIQHTEKVEIEVFAGGMVQLNGEKIDIVELRPILAKKLNTKPSQKIEIITNDAANVQNLVDVIDNVKNAGATNISVSSGN